MNCRIKNSPNWAPRVAFFKTVLTDGPLRTKNLQKQTKMANKRVEIKERKLLSDNWYRLEKITFDYLRNDGTWQQQVRESYDRGNGATVFLYNKTTQHILLVRQFRLPSYLNEHPSGMLLETCAGLLDELDPESCIKKEIEEETGYRIDRVKKVMEAYMTPGAVTEKIHFFIAAYDKTNKASDGGGIETEQEDLEVLEIPFAQAVEMAEQGSIQDAKTLLLIQYARIHKLLETES